MTDSTKNRRAVAQSRVTHQNLQQFVGYNMKRAYLVLQEDMKRVLEPLGLRTMSFAALAVIVENPDITQTQLSLALGIERSGVVVLVDELEEAGHISRNRVEGDRRSYALRASRQGRDHWQLAEAEVRAHEDALLSVLSKAERDALQVSLRRIASAKEET